MQTSLAPCGERLPELLSELSLWKFHKNVPLLKPSSNYFFLWFISRGREKKEKKTLIVFFAFGVHQTAMRPPGLPGQGFCGWKTDRRTCGGVLTDAV